MVSTFGSLAACGKGDGVRTLHVLRHATSNWTGERSPTRVRQRLTFTSTVRTTGDQPLRGLIAHLNVLLR